jgi:hypothetical protein
MQYYFISRQILTEKTQGSKPWEAIRLIIEKTKSAYIKIFIGNFLISSINNITVKD